MRLAKDFAAANKTFDILFWVGCAGAFDDRYKKVTIALATILDKAGITYAVLGDEEACTGDPARRAGNEFLFQMMAVQNIETLNGYGVKKVVTACPHCFNTIKNEYGELGGTYEVLHHSQLLVELLQAGKIKISDEPDTAAGIITYHDSCYLGRANDIYEAPREVISALKRDLVELKRNKKNGLCCGAGGGQMFKEPEKGTKDINIERIEEVLEANPTTVAVACPFCMTMMSDGIKNKNQEANVQVKDLAELIAEKLV